MAEPFLGEVKIVSFNFPPKGWAYANGQLLPISQNEALFALFGTTYGGNGINTFALPNLQSRTPIHFNGAFPQGTAGGEEMHSLSLAEMPTHNHLINVTSDSAQSGVPTSNVPASSVAGLGNVYGPATQLTPMNPASIGNFGSAGLDGHENRMPYLVLNFVVAMQGIFPLQN